MRLKYEIKKHEFCFNTKVNPLTTIGLISCILENLHKHLIVNIQSTLFFDDKVIINFITQHSLSCRSLIIEFIDNKVKEHKHEYKVDPKFSLVQVIKIKVKTFNRGKQSLLDLVDFKYINVIKTEESYETSFQTSKRRLGTAWKAKHNRQVKDMASFINHALLPVDYRNY